MTKADSKFNKDLFTSGDRVLVGLSGGADSVALLLLLCQLRKEKNIEVFACHVNHGIRGEEALRDERFCISLCEKAGVKLFCRHIDVPQLAAERHMSEEMTGRDERYRIFGETAKELGAKIAIAHNKNDVAETVLFNLFRGCSLDGTASLREVRDNIYRPMLNITRAEIEEYVKDVGYMTDSTNGDNEYSRNRIRNVILNEAKIINKKAVENIAEFSFSAWDDKDYLSMCADREYDKLVSSSGLNEKVNDIHPALKRRVIKRFLEENGSAVSRENIEKLISVFQTHKQTEFTGNIFFAYKDGNVFRRFVKEKRKIDEISLKIGENYISNMILTVISVDLDAKKRYNSKEFEKGAIVIDAEKINGMLHVRSKLNGEGFRPAGRGVYKTLKKFFCENGVPSDDRNGVPIIADDTGIVAVVPFAADERAAADNNSKRILVIKTEGKNE